MPWLFDFTTPGLTFDVALHVGTLLSLLIYFRKDWLQLTRSFFSSLKKRPSQYDFQEKLVWYLLIGTIPAAVAGFLIEDYAETVFRNPLLVATMMVLFGTLLYLVDRFGKKTKPLDQITLTDAVLVGIAQCIALIPGSSRSGVTITAGMLRNMDRVTAARFSFLLSTPIVAGAALLKLKDFFAIGGINLVNMTGIAVSALTGYLAIKYMLYFLRKYSFIVYVLYRLAFAAVVFLGYYLKSHAG
jgi:undecaprenyl-diphosphatase